MWSLALTAMQVASKYPGPDDLVFASSKGTPLNENNLMRRVIKAIAKELGMPWLSWHVLRQPTPHSGVDRYSALGPAGADGASGCWDDVALYTFRLGTAQGSNWRRAAIEVISERKVVLPRGFEPLTSCSGGKRL